MVNFEKSSPEEQPNLVKAQWYGDAGAGINRGVDPDVAEELGYTNPESLPIVASPAENLEVNTADNNEATDSPAPERGNHAEDRHERRIQKTLKLQGTTKPKETRQGLGWRGRLTADGPPEHIAKQIRGE